MWPSVYLNVALRSVFKWLKGVFPQHHHNRLLKDFEALFFYVLAQWLLLMAQKISRTVWKTSQKYDLYSVILTDQS